MIRIHPSVTITTYHQLGTIQRTVNLSLSLVSRVAVAAESFLLSLIRQDHQTQVFHS